MTAAVVPITRRDDVEQTTLVIRPWRDEIVEAHGHDLRSVYVETWWTPVLGPTAVCLLRRLAPQLAAWPDGFELDLAATAVALGIGRAHPTRNAPLPRTIARLCLFGATRMQTDGSLDVRTALPPLAARQLRRLPDALVAEHQRWLDGEAVS